ncbi:MAG: hypothetical protein CMD36_00675 [Flavobacteriales bacterium]|nr:hypothetical protein [Flavobacteriales bacterium]
MNRQELVNYILLNSKYSIDEISSKIDVDRSNLYLWKKGKSKPKVGNINKMAAITGHEIKWLNEDEIEVKSVSRKKLMSDNSNSNSKEMISLQSENIRLLREKIQFLEDEIHNLKSQNTNDNNWKTHLSTFNIQSFITFKNKKNFEETGYEIHQSVERKVEGNTTCLGYTTEDLEQMSPKEFNNLYHPESINDGFKIISLLSGTTNSNSTISLDGVSILKSKNQKWITFNCKMHWERDFKNPNNWISNAYYTELEPVN